MGLEPARGAAQAISSPASIAPATGLPECRTPLHVVAAHRVVERLPGLSMRVKIHMNV
ncbi:MAG: hypothetical protein NVS3B18_01530 [Candidatus Dormibacteria bacterium]